MEKTKKQKETGIGPLKKDIEIKNESFSERKTGFEIEKNLPRGCQVSVNLKAFSRGLQNGLNYLQGQKVILS